jgi:U4/U6 small nuclear ribonucleoprotein PRP31
MIRMLASKTALTSRVDVCKTYPDGSQGEQMREGILLRYSKITAVGQNKLNKILAKPDDKPRKKRGGAKKQNQKLKFEMTMQRKLQNKIAFGVTA